MLKHIHTARRKVAEHLNGRPHLAAAYIAAGLFAVFSVLYQFSLTHAASDGTVTGVFVEPNSTTPVANVSVSLHNSNWSYSNYQTTGSDGRFTFSSVPAGSQKLEIYYYASSPSYFAPDSQNVSVTAEQTTDLGNVAMLAPNIFGKVVSPDGTTGIANASVTIRTSDWSINKWTQTDSSGVFKHALSTNGSYIVEVWTSGTDYSRPDNQTITYAGSAVYLDGTNSSQAIRATNPAMRGKVVLTDGTTAAQYASLTLFDSNNVGMQWASTDSNGLFKIDSVANGTYTLKVFPPYDKSGLVGPDPITVTLNKGDTNTTYLTTPITLSQAQKTITGTVKRPNGSAITSGYVSAWQYYGGGYGNTSINTDGTFTLLLGSGEWYISVYPNWNNGAPDWSFAGSPKKVAFTQSNTVAESASVEFSVLSFTATYKGRVTLPDGSIPGTSEYTSISAWSDGGGSNWAQLGTDGSFSMKLPPGTFSVNLYTSGSQYTAPKIPPITLSDGDTYDAGTVSLLRKDATITGAIRDTNGKGLSGQSVSTWLDGGSGWGWTQTDINGNYSIPVSAGRWCVSSYPNWDPSQQYVNTTEPLCVSVVSNSTKADVNFTFALADAKVEGSVVDQSSNPVTSVNGWLDARKAQSSSVYYMGIGAAISSGTYSIKVPAGTWNLCPWVGYSGDYASGDCKEVTMTAGETKTGQDIILLPSNATVTGSFKDVDGKILTDVYGSVSAQRVNSNSYLWSSVDKGTYRMKGAAGTWKLSCWVDPGTSAQYYLDGACAADVIAKANDTVTHDIVLKIADSEISVKAIDPDGNPLPNALVSVDTSFGEAKTLSYGLYGYWFNRNKSTDQNGNLTLKVPNGTYFVSASVPTDFGYINPDKTVVTTAAGNPAAVTLQFRKPDATIVGTVVLKGAAVPSALVSASNDDGGYAETTTDASGTYQLPVIKGDTWDVVVSVDNKATDVGYREGTSVAVTEVGTVSAGTITLGDSSADVMADVPEAASTTASTNTQIVVSAENGAAFTAPANSISTQNITVAVTITPTVEAPETSTDVLATPIAYDVEVRQQTGQNAGQEVTNFISDINLTLPYDESALKAAGVSEDALAVKYWSDEADTYLPVNSYSVDKDKNEVTVTVNHATKFAIVTRPVEKASVTPGLSVPTTAPVVTPDVAVLSTKQIAVLTTNKGRGPVVTLYNQNGTKAKSFRPFSRLATGDFAITAGDLTGDKVDEVIAFDRKGTQRDVAVYTVAGEKLGTIRLAEGSQTSVIVANLNGDAADQLIITAANQSRFTVYKYQAKKFSVLATHQPFASGGVAVSVGNITGDSTPELIAASRNAQPQVAVYRLNAKSKTFQFVARADKRDISATGATVTLADVTGDQHAEVILEPAVGKGRIVATAVKGRTLARLGQVTASFTSLITLGDLTGDNKADVLVSSADRTKLTLHAYDAKRKAFKELTNFTPFGSKPLVNAVADLAIRDFNADGKREVVVSRADGQRVLAFNITKAKGKLTATRAITYSLASGGILVQRLYPDDLNGDGKVEIVALPKSNVTKLGVLNFGKHTLIPTNTIKVGSGFQGLLNVASTNR